MQNIDFEEITSEQLLSLFPVAKHFSEMLAQEIAAYRLNVLHDHQSETARYGETVIVRSYPVALTGYAKGGVVLSDSYRAFQRSDLLNEYAATVADELIEQMRGDLARYGAGSSICFASRRLSLPIAGSGAIGQYLEAKDDPSLRVIVGYDVNALGQTITVDCLYGVSLKRAPAPGEGTTLAAKPKSLVERIVKKMSDWKRRL